MKKKLMSIFVATLVMGTLFTACGTKEQEVPEEPTAEAATEAATAAEATPAADTSGEKPYIAVVSKGFQHQFWQVVAEGANDAAIKYDVEITFEGPPSESDIGIQVDMLNAAIAKEPDAICLAALDTEAVLPQINEAMQKNIPIIGFDSGVPSAPEGAVISTAATDNYAAGKMAAQEMAKAPGFADKVKAATPESPVMIVVQSQDATGASIIDRTNGFIDEAVKMASVVHPDAVEVVGHDVFAAPSVNPAAVTIKVVVPPTTSVTDAQSAAQVELQNNENLIGYYCSNELSVSGLLAATSDGTDLDRTDGIYKDLIVVGFDAGAPQKNAVKNQYFYGSITQDPYMIGFNAVELAVKTINGETVPPIVDTGAKFYTSENMDDPDIAKLIYD